MEYYQIKNCIFSGIYKNVYQSAWLEYTRIKRRSKRTVYVRSKYFKKDKIFLNIFWGHLKQKSKFERRRRLKFYGCAIKLIEKSMISPISKDNPNNQDEILHRFVGKVNNRLFIIQIKENKRTDRKDLISVFPWRE